MTEAWLLEFVATYNRFSKLGSTDAFGGMESRRVLCELIEVGDFPTGEHLETGILLRANAPAVDNDVPQEQA